MDRDRPSVALYQAAWCALAVAFLATLAVWGTQLGSVLGAGAVATAPTVQPTEVPQIVTVNPDLGLPYAATLCAEISPRPDSITIESVGGAIISTDRC